MKTGVKLCTESDNPQPESPRPRKRIGKSTLFVLTILFVAWVLVAVPGLRERSFSYAPQWKGQAVIHTFGWPYIHSAKLTIEPTVANKLLKVDTIDIAEQATEERFDACLQSLRWSKTQHLYQISRPPALMHARPVDEYDLRNPPGKRFWSEPQNWRYWDKNAYTRWYFYGLLANGLILLVFLSLVAVCLEFLRRRRKRWFQLSLMDFLALVLVVGAATSVYTRELWLSRKQIALATNGVYEETAPSGSLDLVDDDLGDDLGVSSSVELQSPVFLSRLVDATAGWQRLVPETAFYRITSLSIEPARIKTESEFNELIELLKSGSLNYVERLAITITDQDQFFILDLLPTENVAEVYVSIHHGGNDQIPLDKAVPRQPLDTSLKALERFRELESLTIYCDWSQFEYPNLPWLKRLDAGWINGVDGRAKDWIASMQELECITVGGTDLESCFEHLPPSIRRLHFQTQDEEQIDLSSLSRLKQLEYLTGYANGKKTKITAVPVLPNLKQLMLESFEWDNGQPDINAFLP